MPRGFSQQEQDIIRRKLLEAGKHSLATYGVRKTNLEELTNAAGISKGAFYKFYDSKEHLFFEVLENFEAEYRLETIQRLQSIQTGTPYEQVRVLLHEAFHAYRSHPMFGNFNPQDYEILLRKLPPELVQGHLKSDDGFVGELMQYWQASGVVQDHDPVLISALMKALFYVSLHAEEIGTAFQDAFNILLDLVAGYVAKE